MIPPERTAEIRRLFFAEHWKVGTIAQQLDVHHDTVRAALEVHRFQTTMSVARGSQLDPYRALLEQTLAQYPTLRATRLFEMVQARGYRGSAKTLRRYVQALRPRPREAFLRLRTMPGEQAQVDWAHFGHLRIGAAQRPLSCFVMVLSWSRAMYARFFLDQTLPSFLRGHVLAFESLGGVPRTLLYDNLKTAVLERQGEHIRYHPQLLELAGHYHFAPKPCAPRRGNEKGKVERAIQYLRHSFFAARRYADLQDLNAQLGRWIEQIAHARPAPEDEARRSVHTLWEEERPQLLELPSHAFDCATVRATCAAKTPYVRFDDNEYSIPVSHVGTPVTLAADETHVRVLEAEREIARHVRHWGRRQRITDEAHIAPLMEQKHAARVARGRDAVSAECSHAQAFLAAVARANGPVRHETLRLRKLLEQYGGAALDQALAAALERGAYAAASVAYWLEQHTRTRGAPPPLPVVLPDDARVRDLRVEPHALGPYDKLSEGGGDHE